jgi:hypothetical protein
MQNSTTVPASPPIIRSSKWGCWQLKGNAIGRYLIPITDPLATDELTKEHIDGFELSPDFVPIDATTWQRWVQLCFHFCDKIATTTEVSVRLLRKDDDPSKWRIVVPPQSVGRATVTTSNFADSLDIETGEPIGQWPPEGWTPMGSSHSHNTMGAFFSATDDTYELGDPGLHLVVGSIDLTKRSYAIAASVVAPRPGSTTPNNRFKIDYGGLVDASPIEEVTFHPDVLEIVKFQPRPSTEHWVKPQPKGLWNNANKQASQNRNNWKGQSGYDDADDTNFDDYYGYTNWINPALANASTYQLFDVLSDRVKDRVKSGNLLALETMYENALEFISTIATAVTDISGQSLLDPIVDIAEATLDQQQDLLDAIDEELIDLTNSVAESGKPRLITPDPSTTSDCFFEDDTVKATPLILPPASNDPDSNSPQPSTSVSAGSAASS